MSKMNNIIEYVKSNPGLKTSFVAAKFKVHPSTVRRCRSEAGLGGASPIPKANLKYDRVKAFVKEHPEASAREIAYGAGVTSSYAYLLMKKPNGKLFKELSWEASKTSLTSVIPQEYREEPKTTVAKEPKEEPVQEEDNADANFFGYGKWMTRDELIGYLKGSVVSTLTKGSFTKADLKSVGWKIIKLSELID